MTVAAGSMISKQMSPDIVQHSLSLRKDRTDSWSPELSVQETREPKGERWNVPSP